MRKPGKFSLEEEERIFTLPKDDYFCERCKKRLKDHNPVFVCEMDKSVYCMCFRELGSKICPNYFHRDEHTDILCTLRIK
jgi:hypothetical protein|tara:strand:- start:1050 stop:1289 length:240 start_codon:yes stop_codon:yes gene_type:complete